MRDLGRVREIRNVKNEAPQSIFFNALIPFAAVSHRPHCEMRAVALRSSSSDRRSRRLPGGRRGASLPINEFQFVAILVLARILPSRALARGEEEDRIPVPTMQTFSFTISSDEIVSLGSRREIACSGD